ncbi:thioredoxin, partial [Xanthomonas sontii]
MVQETRPEPSLKMKAVDGREYDLAAHRGQWVVVNFWATWCAPCLKEMPELSALHVMRDNIEVVGLAYEDIEPAEMQAFLKQHPVAYP